MYGRTYKGVERSTFLVGDGGEVEREWRAVKAGGHAAEVLEAARSAG
jgi:peroxiredoxin Q/BCP